LRNKTLNTVSHDLLSVSPLIFRLVRRKIARTTSVKLDLNITPLHLEIINLLEEYGELHVCEIGEKLHIARAQLTGLIDKLAALNIIERSVDAADRRTFIISLTAEGRAILKSKEQEIMKAVQEIVSSLSDEDLEKLSFSLRTLRGVLLKANRAASHVTTA
jgi:DNA-binding MarR family transcriptional regulator